MKNRCFTGMGGASAAMFTPIGKDNKVSQYKAVR